MADIIDIRRSSEKGDLVLCRLIDQRVAKFNEIANQEIIQESAPSIPQVDPNDIESTIANLETANDQAQTAFQENLTRTTLPNKIEALKEAFGQIADLGMDAVREEALNSSNDDNIDAIMASLDTAIRRLTHVLDVMNDDDSKYAPDLVQSDALYKDKKWAPVLEHRDQISNDLRGHLTDFIQRQSNIFTPKAL